MPGKSLSPVTCILSGPIFVSDPALTGPQSPLLHTEVLGCEWTVNHHFGILYCFWVNCFCSPLPPVVQAERLQWRVGAGWLLGTQWPRGCW